MKELTIHGCSFSENLKCNFYPGIEDKLSKDFNYANYAINSNSNQGIQESAITAGEDSIAIIQWSALTRKLEWEKDWEYLDVISQPDALFRLLDRWINQVRTTTALLNQRGVKHFQYIGWAQWKDSELTDEYRQYLRALPIHWFESKEQEDLIQSNCWQLNHNPNEWSDIKDGKITFPKLEWGGMSEWIRENVDINDRYIGYDNHSKEKWFDPHPSATAGKQFFEQVIYPFIYE